MMIVIVREIDIDINKIPIFASKEYLSSKSNNYGWFKTDNFLLPFIIDKHLVFKRLVFTTETIYLDENRTIDDEKQFLNNVIQYCGKNKICDFIYKPQANCIFKTYPDNAKVAKWGTYEIDLSKDIEDIFNNIHTKHKNVIRKAMKNNVKIKFIDIEVAYENIKETFVRQNSLYYPTFEYLNKLKNNLKNNLIILGVFYSNQLQGCAIIPFSKERAYYLYGGSIKNPFTGSINYMHFEIMKILKEKDVKYYDLMGARLCYEKGSKFEGLQRFKSRFGANLKKGYTFIVPISKIKYKLFLFLVKIYFKLKGSYFEEPIKNLRECYENTNNTRL